MGEGTVFSTPIDYCLYLKDGEGTVFSLFVSPHLNGGYPIPGLGGGTLFQVLVGGTSSQVWVGVPISGLHGGTPSQVCMGREVPCPRSGLGVHHPRSGWWGYPGTPQLGLDGGGHPGYATSPPARSGWLDGGRIPGVPPARSGWGYPFQGLGGGTPSQVWVGGTPSLVWVGVPIPGLHRGTLSQVMVGLHHPRSGWWGVPRVCPLPKPGLDGWMVGGYPGYPLARSGWGTPHPLDRAA